MLTRMVRPVERGVPMGLDPRRGQAAPAEGSGGRSSPESGINRRRCADDGRQDSRLDAQPEQLGVIRGAGFGAPVDRSSPLPLADQPAGGSTWSLAAAGDRRRRAPVCIPVVSPTATRSCRAPRRALPHHPRRIPSDHRWCMTLHFRRIGDDRQRGRWPPVPAALSALPEPRISPLHTTWSDQYLLPRALYSP